MTKHKHVYRQYVIREHRETNIFSIYDDEGEYLHEAETLDAAKDWIDAEQAGEHDQ